MAQGRSIRDANGGAFEPKTREEAQLRPAVARAIDRYYPVDTLDGCRWLDGTKAFYDWIFEGINASWATILDIGAGPSVEATRSLRGKVARVVGVDVDPAVLKNPCLDEAHVFDGIHLIFPPASFDAVVSDWTIEHVESPAELLSEVNRVLKPGGSYWFRTTNRDHYVTLVAAHTPHWFHRLIANRLRGLPRTTHDPWRAYYRMNTPPQIRRYVELAGFRSCDIKMLESHPSYLMFNALAFRAGVAYERLVNRYRRLERFRLTILAKATK